LQVFAALRLSLEHPQSHYLSSEMFPLAGKLPWESPHAFNEPLWRLMMGFPAAAGNDYADSLSQMPDGH
jgi:hypothetical protein